MDAIELLKSDHQGAKKAMEGIEKENGPKKMAMFKALKKELEIHDSIEETIFYPSVRSNPKAASFPAADKQAHETVEKALARLALLPIEDKDWAPAFKAMQTKLLKHVSDEETNFFVKIRDVLSAAELNTLGDKMKAEKDRQLKS